MPAHSHARSMQPMTKRATWPIRTVSEKAMRKEIADNTKKLEDIAASGQTMRDDIFKILDRFVSEQQAQFEQFKRLIECSQGEMRELRKTVNEKLKAMQSENAKQMKRLGEAFIQAAGGNEQP